MDAWHRISEVEPFANADKETPIELTTDRHPPSGSASLLG